MSAEISLASLNSQDVDAWNSQAPTERTLDVAWWFPPGEAPQADVRLRFHGDRLVETHPVPESERGAIPRLAWVPPLVNAHCHLEFSGLLEPLTPPSPFPDWIRSVIRWRMEHVDECSSGIVEGLGESAASGIFLLGEITTAADAWRVLAEHSGDVKTVSFRELIGFLPDAIEPQLQALQNHLQDLAAADVTDRVLPGVSPHAPYSVHPDLLDAAVAECGAASVPVAMHLAETTDELQLLQSGTGRFRDFLGAAGLWDDCVLPAGGKVLSYLQQLARVPRALAVHGNYLTDDEIAFVAQNPHVAVVYCPRTHHYFGHRDHPWQKIRAAGGTVVLGTDGRSSNPDLSIWKELQFCAQQAPGLPVQQLLGMITEDAATALGVDLSLDPGAGTLIVLPAESCSDERSLLKNSTRPVARLSAGKILLCGKPSDGLNLSG